MATKRTSEPDELGREVRAGLPFATVAHGCRQIGEFATSIALARLLGPEEFGIVAIGNVFLQLSYVVGNLGMNEAVVQCDDLQDDDRDVAFTVSTAIGVLITLLITALSPAAATFFNTPLLATVIPLMSIQIVLSAVTAIPLALLRRKLKFRELAVVDVGSMAAYAISSVGLILLGAGIWGLVWAPVVSGVWAVVAGLQLSRYRPRFRLLRSSMRKLVGFGSMLVVKNVFVHLGRNGDNVVVAKMLGDAATGVYSRAFNFSTMPQTRLVSLAYSVSFPAFCRLRNDSPRLHDWYIRVTRGIAAIVCPILLGMLALADDLTLAVLGSHWSGMVGPFRLLCVAGVFNSLHQLGGAAIEASGKLRYEVLTESVYALLIPLGSLLLIGRGVEGVGMAVVFASMVMFAMKAMSLRAAIGLPIGRFVRSTLPAIACATIMCVFVRLCRDLSLDWTGSELSGLWLRVVGGTLLGFVSYAASMMLLAPNDVRLVLGEVQSMVPLPAIPLLRRSGVVQR